MIDKGCIAGLLVNENFEGNQPLLQIFSASLEVNGWVFMLFDGESKVKALLLKREARFEPLNIIKLVKFLVKSKNSEFPLILFDVELVKNSEIALVDPRHKNLTQVITSINQIQRVQDWRFFGKVIEKSEILQSKLVNEYFTVVFEDLTGDRAEIIFFGRFSDKFFNYLDKGQSFWVSQGRVKLPNPKMNRSDVLITIEVNERTIITKIDEIRTFQQESEKIPDSLKTIQRESNDEENKYLSIDSTSLQLKPETSSFNGFKSITLSTFYFLDSLKMKPGESYQTKVFCYVNLISSQNCDRLFYKSCPVPRCCKKLQSVEENKFFCPKCEKEMENFRYKYLVRLPLSDSTRLVYVTVFDRCAQKIFGISAECFQYWNITRHERIEKIINSLLGQQILAEILVRCTINEKKYELIDIHPGIMCFEKIMEDIHEAFVNN
jgi:hypothetical protein